MFLSHAKEKCLLHRRVVPYISFATIDVVYPKLPTLVSTIYSLLYIFFGVINNKISDKHGEIAEETTCRDVLREHRTVCRCPLAIET